MRVFGENEIEWRGFNDGPDGDTHVLVATRASSWDFLCHATPDEYETVERTPQPSAEPWVWRHDRARVSCEMCRAVLDGAAVVRVVPA